jgi:CRP-like cAMP-binding protein
MVINNLHLGGICRRRISLISARALPRYILYCFAFAEIAVDATSESVAVARRSGHCGQQARVKEFRIVLGVRRSRLRSNAVGLGVKIQGQLKGGTAVKKYFPESTARSKSLPSNKAPGILPLLRDLKPRFLEGLTPSELKSVVAEGGYRKFPANCVITNQDHSAQRLYLLLTGRARFFFLTDKGREVILLWIPPGEIFGSSALLPAPAGYHVSVAAIRSCSALVWDRITIRRLAALYPRLLENAFYLTLHYLSAYRAAHGALISDTSQERLAQVLVSLASGIGEKVASGVELKITNEELANEANVSLFTASRAVSQWHRTGLLLKGRGKILLRFPEQLLRNARNEPSGN